jgi:hypothetical protein
LVDRCTSQADSFVALSVHPRSICLFDTVVAVRDEGGAGGFGSVVADATFE